jgi:hypothetical protein
VGFLFTFGGAGACFAVFFVGAAYWVDEGAYEVGYWYVSILGVLDMADCGRPVVIVKALSLSALPR